MRVKTYRASRSRSAPAQAKVKTHVSQGQGVRAFYHWRGMRERGQRDQPWPDASGVRGREQGLTPRKVSDRVTWGYVGLGGVR